MLVDSQTGRHTETNRQTDIQTRSLQYFATAPVGGGEKNTKNIKQLANASRKTYHFTLNLLS